MLNWYSTNCTYIGWLFTTLQKYEVVIWHIWFFFSIIAITAIWAAHWFWQPEKTSLYLTRDNNGQPKPNLGQKKVARPSPISVNEEFRLSHLYLSWSIELWKLNSIFPKKQFAVIIRKHLLLYYTYSYLLSWHVWSFAEYTLHRCIFHSMCI